MDIQKTIYVNNLIDCYGVLLTNKQLKIMKDYFENDYSLNEMANNEGVTKQAISYTIKLALDTLNVYEDKLHLLDKKIQLNDYIKSIKKEIKSERMEIVFNKILNIVEE